jgi:2-amino-4-hydroxy-6-hydroxymethyldihydropteridine diphosphokinase
MPSTSFLGIGTNLGDREQNISKSIALINDAIGEVTTTSHIYETEPWGFESENTFLNIVLKVQTELKPVALLRKIHGIENQLGRVRNDTQYSSRIVDIDILFYNNIIINRKNMQIPHPRVSERRFVLVPLCEIEPDGIHPVLGKSFSNMLDECRDDKKVREYK